MRQEQYQTISEELRLAQEFLGRIHRVYSKINPPNGNLITWTKEALHHVSRADDILTETRTHKPRRS